MVVAEGITAVVGGFIIDLASRALQAGIQAVQFLWQVTIEFSHRLFDVAQALLRLAFSSFSQTHMQAIYVVAFLCLGYLELSSAYFPGLPGAGFSPSSLLAELPTTRTVDVADPVAIKADLSELLVANLSSTINPGGVAPCAMFRELYGYAGALGYNSSLPEYAWTLYSIESVPRTWDAPNGEIITEPKDVRDYYTWSACQITLEANARSLKGTSVYYSPNGGGT